MRFATPVGLLLLTVSSALAQATGTGAVPSPGTTGVPGAETGTGLSIWWWVIGIIAVTAVIALYFRRRG